MIPSSSRMTMPISERVDFPLPNPPHKGEGYRIWIAAAVPGSLFSPAGRSAERMRGDEGAARHNFSASRPPHPALRATFSPLGRRGTPPRAPLKIHMQLPCQKGEGACRRMSLMLRIPFAASDVRACGYPPLSLRDISPTRGESGGCARRRPQSALPPCGGDARQGRGGYPQIPGSISCP
ncbi:hypothetical protein J2045_000598 [Peteryoungia aggregata LMG 23059]|uniref:Uncharacterized protein n=1 Tax=Peteryoungia aggregata LMG 23059 TaxID=1368425 RepID=A0ABU0G2M7_9HYPH|nr:hypothetical protein [Peteryoungia aggregata LMG 23059]